MNTYYEPGTPPEPAEWLSLSDQERIRLVTHYLQSAKIRRPKALAPLHVLVEDYLAQGHGPAKQALNRQLAGGASRAESIQVLAGCLARSYEQTFSDPSAQQAAFVAALRAIDTSGARSDGT